jgi:hypothetical protein
MCSNVKERVNHMHSYRLGDRKDTTIQIQVSDKLFLSFFLLLFMVLWVLISAALC